MTIGGVEYGELPGRYAAEVDTAEESYMGDEHWIHRYYTQRGLAIPPHLQAIAPQTTVATVASPVPPPLPPAPLGAPPTASEATAPGEIDALLARIRQSPPPPAAMPDVALRADLDALTARVAQLEGQLTEALALVAALVARG